MQGTLGRHRRLLSGGAGTGNRLVRCSLNVAVTCGRPWGAGQLKAGTR